MSWDIRIDTGQRTMWLSGELTIFSVADVRRQLVEMLETHDEIAVDLAEVTEADTAGLQLMLLAKRKPGKRVRFCNHADAVLKLVDLANLGQTLGDPLIITAS